MFNPEARSKMRQNSYDNNVLENYPSQSPPLHRLHHIPHHPHPVHPQERKTPANCDQRASLLPYLRQYDFLGQQTDHVDGQDDRVRPPDGDFEAQLLPVVVAEAKDDVDEVYEVAEEVYEVDDGGADIYVLQKCYF